jgi:hypothetical protein
LTEYVDAILEEHRQSSEARHKEIISRLEGAFPGGDAEAHRKYHEILIQREQWRQQFCDKIIEHMAEKGVWASVVGLGWAIWYGLQVIMNKGPN